MAASEPRISTSLYELSDALQRAVLDAVDPDSGELLDGFEAALDKLEGDVKAKAVNVALFALGLQTEADATAAVGDAIKAQAQVRYDAATVLRNQATRLLEYLDRNLQAVEITEIKDPRVRIHYRKSEAIEVMRPDLVPDRYRLDPKPPGPSKKKLKDAMDVRGVDELLTEDILLEQALKRPFEPSVYAVRERRSVLKVS